MIESGRKDSSPWIHIPATFFKVLHKGVDVVHYVSEKSDKVGGREIAVPQGHVIGGGSSVNAMVYIRGQSQDYDGWAQMGNAGWSYNDVLPVFRDIESNTEIADQFHGTDGELRVSETGFHHPLSHAFIRAAQQAGINHNPDFNGANQEGVGFYQTTTHGGRRWSAAKAFLRKAQLRPNLTIRTNTRVARIQFEGNRASGVELENGECISAVREVILCAGAIATPRLMQLSGLGNAEELATLGINIVANLPGVGENYQDHLQANVQCYTKDPISCYQQDKGLKSFWHMLQYQVFKTGILTSNIVECGGFIDVSDEGLPDVQFHALPFLIGSGDSPPPQAHGMSINPCFLRPFSRGSVKLRSSNPRDKAMFNTGSLSDAEDVEVLVRGIKRAIEIFQTPELSKLVTGFVSPGPKPSDDDDALREWIRQTCKTVFHPCGTAKMGPDNDVMAVVDNQLRVKGVEGLRIADASVMPTIISGNTNAAVIMIAERASRFIMERDYSWLSLNVF